MAADFDVLRTGEAVLDDRRDTAFPGRRGHLHGDLPGALRGALLMSALVLVHIGAALMHLIVIKDGVFRRMWG